MTKQTLLAGVSLVVFALAVPDVVGAQASRRGGSDSSPAPSSGGQSTGSGGDGGSASPRSPQDGSRSTGSAQPRSGPATTSRPGGSSQSDAAGPATRGDGRAVSGGVSRGTGSARVSRGQAQPRPSFVAPGIRQPFTYWGRSYSPWYSSSYGSYGFYDPWWYGSGYGFGYGPGRWSRYPYGFGPGVFGYLPYGDPYLPYSGGGSYYRDQYRDDDNDRSTGSIRLRASPRDARVYIDGALVGTVDDFDGLTHHLDLDAGVHQLELRADGYQTYTAEITVRTRKTMTERASLKKIE